MRKIIRKIFRYFKRKGKRQLKVMAKKAVVAYSVSVLPVGYLTTAITQRTASLTQPIQTLQVLARGGVKNILTGGFARPLEQATSQVGVWVETGKYQLQSLFSDVGTWTGWYQLAKPEPVRQVEPSEYLGEIMNWSFDNYPDYYRVIGQSEIDPSVFPEYGKITYGGLDNLGRTMTVKGALTYQNVAKSYGKREQFTQEANPSGWKQGKNERVAIYWIGGKVYHGYLWNRSHLIADSLGGKAERENVITGTRPQNVGGTDQKGGMRYTEKKAQEWLEKNQDGVVFYQAEPIYNQDELIPRGVIVSLLSSNGSLNEKVIVYNTANGYSINYYTGEYTPN